MALQKIIYHSEQLNMKMGVNVIIPENKLGYSLADRPFGYTIAAERSIRFCGCCAAEGSTIPTGSAIRRWNCSPRRKG